MSLYSAYFSTYKLFNLLKLHVGRKLDLERDVERNDAVRDRPRADKSDSSFGNLAHLVCMGLLGSLGL